jgi:hypothetical protein
MEWLGVPPNIGKTFVIHHLIHLVMVVFTSIWLEFLTISGLSILSNTIQAALLNQRTIDVCYSYRKLTL